MSSPPIVPELPSAEVYLVLDDFGEYGRAYRETDPQKANRSAVVRDLLEGQYSDPISITAFSLAEGWVRDVSKDVANEVVDVARLELERLPENTQRFIERQLGEVPAWPVF